MTSFSLGETLEKHEKTFPSFDPLGVFPMSSVPNLMTTMTEADELDPTSIRPATQRGGSEADWPPPTIDDLTLTLADLNTLTLFDAPPMDDGEEPPATVREEVPRDDCPADVSPKTLPSGSLLLQAMQAAQEKQKYNTLHLGSDLMVGSVPSYPPSNESNESNEEEDDAESVESGEVEYQNQSNSTVPMPPLPSSVPPAPTPAPENRRRIAPTMDGTVMLRPPQRPHPQNVGPAAATQTMVLRGLLNKPRELQRPRGNAVWPPMRAPMLTPSPESGAAPPGPFDVELIEHATPTPIRYRDAVRLGEDHVLLVVTDFARGSVLTPALLARWKRVVRQAGARGDTPDAILQILNQELTEVGLQATAVCARLDLRERLLLVACAGAPAPFVLRSDERVVRVRVSPSVALGRVANAQFAETTLHFDQGDTVLVGSEVYETALDGVFETSVHRPTIATGKVRVADRLRQSITQPVGGALLCLTVN